MSEKIKVAIAGYGNIGKAVEAEVVNQKDMELVCVFTRRDINKVKSNSKVPVINEKNIAKWKNRVDIVFLCGGSAKDLPIQAPKYAKYFNIIDAFDTHQKALEYSKALDKVALEFNTLATSSIGWDPGLFSAARLVIKSIMPDAKIYTFWGPGVSQGHSEAIRNIKGVKDARQYTYPIKSTIRRVREGKLEQFTKRQMHKRICYVVLEQAADKKKITKKIKTMPDYFEGYDTKVRYISNKKMLKRHSSLPHGGTVIGVGNTGKKQKQVVEFKLDLSSNPAFTAAVLIAYARATHIMYLEGKRGYQNFSDVPLKYLTDMQSEDIIKEIL